MLFFKEKDVIKLLNVTVVSVMLVFEISKFDALWFTFSHFFKKSFDFPICIQLLTFNEVYS